ncbi:MAG TPA: DUF116 domain-containing protein [Candidatus Cloacimonadota bacterium]|nr:DUF116 domain-containing protein [Candidatus Cloacimonadota bacterium]HPT70944.1 DUF116 domain-containing protein [Candidatus Cloacimonadota bacterium]
MFDERMDGRKTDFIFLTTLSFGACLLVLLGLWWLVAPRIQNLHRILHMVMSFAVDGFVIIFVLSFLLLIVHVLSQKTSFMGKYIRWFFLHTYPIAYRLGRLLGIGFERLGNTFITVNNLLVCKIQKRYTAKEMMILLPHCLQKQVCEQRIVKGVDNCIECGACTLKDFKEISRESGIAVHVATGGTLARRIIATNRPLFIIAVACHRDLVDGIEEAYPIPVYGILNERPEGPCVNTTVEIERVRKAIQYFIKS